MVGSPFDPHPQYAFQPFCITTVMDPSVVIVEGDMGEPGEAILAIIGELVLGPLKTMKRLPPRPFCVPSMTVEKAPACSEGSWLTTVKVW